MSGLNPGQQVILQSSTGEILTVSSNGSFAFQYPIAVGSTYSVSIKNQPAAEACALTSGSGVIASGNVNSVTITCSAITYPFAFNPSNGHFYQFVRIDASYTYAAMQSLASASTYLGYVGHLATVTSDSENAFLFSAIQSNPLATGNYWFISGSNALDPSTWIITDGPESGTVISLANLVGLPTSVLYAGDAGTIPQITPSSSYSNWWTGEPNNYYGAKPENYIILNWGPNGQWNNVGSPTSPYDSIPNQLGMIVEYEAQW
jgi:hypothetical protein